MGSDIKTARRRWALEVGQGDHAFCKVPYVVWRARSDGDRSWSEVNSKTWSRLSSPDHDVSLRPSHGLLTAKYHHIATLLVLARYYAPWGDRTPPSLDCSFESNL